MPFDTDIFINEISMRRPLWDANLKDYSNRDVKSKLWVEVAVVVVENWDKLSNEEKNKEVQDLQKRWKSLRNAFARELRFQKMPSGSESKRRKKYCYFDQLLFLVGTINDGESTSNLQDSQPVTTPADEVQEVGEIQQQQPSIDQQARPYSTNSKRAKQSSFETAILKHLEGRKAVDDEEEADKNFLLSFLPSFKKLPMERKMWARVSISQVMQQAATAETPPSTHINNQPRLPFSNHTNMSPFPSQQTSNFHYQATPFQQSGQQQSSGVIFSNNHFIPPNTNIFSHGSDKPTATKTTSPSLASDSASDASVFSVYYEDL